MSAGVQQVVLIVGSQQAGGVVRACVWWIMVLGRNLMPRAFMPGCFGPCPWKGMYYTCCAVFVLRGSSSASAASKGRIGELLPSLVGVPAIYCQAGGPLAVCGLRALPPPAATAAALLHIGPCSQVDTNAWPPGEVPTACVACAHDRDWGGAALRDQCSWALHRSVLYQASLFTL